MSRIEEFKKRRIALIKDQEDIEKSIALMTDCKHSHRVLKDLKIALDATKSEIKSLRELIEEAGRHYNLEQTFKRIYKPLLGAPSQYILVMDGAVDRSIRLLNLTQRYLWSSIVKVQATNRITESEFDKICGGRSSEFVVVGNR